MKRSLKGLGLCVLLALFASCVSQYPFYIEVREPAPVTLPTDVTRILVVNNAVVQPSGIGISRKLNGKEVAESLLLDTDSLSWKVIDALVDQLEASDLFDDVAFYMEELRKDEDWQITKPLDEAFRKEILEDGAFDGIISIDQIVFFVDESTKGSNSSYPSELSVDIAALASMQVSSSVYYYDRQSPLTSFSVKDSVVFEMGIVSDSTLIFQFIPQLMLNDLSQLLGQEIASHVTPQWSEKERQVYVGSNSRMKEAFAYADQNKWKEALAVWTAEYQSTTDSKKQSRIAMNMALAYELTDQLTLALEWAERGEALLKQTNPSNQETIYARQYITDIKKRIQQAKLLDMQLGE